MTAAPITDAHAARIAKRLARHAQKPDKLLPKGVVRRLWALLDSHDTARTAYNRPPDRSLEEHAATMTPDELEGAAERLEGGVPVSTRTGPDTHPPVTADPAEKAP
jgi:hypothetical protein